MDKTLKRLLLLLPLLSACVVCVNCYVRPPPRKNLFLRRPENGDSTTPEQVHISLVGQDKMRISWITEDSSPATVQYGTSPDANGLSATGTTNSYRYMLYHSGEIHDVVIGPLKPSTVYYYRCGSTSSRVYSFKTPPAQLPIRFAVVGDLGQTGWTNSTLEHLAKANYDVLLLPGDLAYADFIQTLWDSFGRLVEPLASQRPWMVAVGNHEVEKIPVVHSTPFTSYNSRWRMPYDISGSDSNLYYSFDTAGVHVIMLGSYTDFDSGSPQYKWLQQDLAWVQRDVTPWVVVIIHAPWYNSNEAHRDEHESTGMKAAMESLLYEARVDVVFAGHVHAYERFTRVYRGSGNTCGPIHITIGDGGNREGLASKYDDPHPEISLFREASFGHGLLEVVNSTHAFWSWHKNDNEEATISDSVWLTSLASDSNCKV